jgi:TetR/AcrR family transcriptional regulator
MLDDDERVDAILDAAYVCFTRHGVRRTTMDDLARQAGMSRPAVYQYVRNKEDAFQRLVRRLLDETLAASRAGMESERGLARRLAAALEAKLALVTRVWRDSPAHAAELLSIDARMSADLIADFDEAMHQLLADALLKAHPGTDAKAVAEILLALTRGLEADLTTPGKPVRRLRQGVALIGAGLDTVKETS